MHLLNRENKINLILVSIIITLDQISKYIITKNYDYYLNKTFLAKNKLKRFTNKNIKKYESLFDRI